jgi:hypothetical protein
VAWVFERVVDAPLQRWIKARETKVGAATAVSGTPVQA